jgi:hypothetical protein
VVGGVVIETLPSSARARGVVSPSVAAVTAALRRSLVVRRRRWRELGELLVDLGQLGGGGPGLSAERPGEVGRPACARAVRRHGA